MVCAIGFVPMSRRRRVGIVGIASPARYCRALIWRIFQESRERRGPAPDVVYVDALASRLSATIGLSLDVAVARVRAQGPPQLMHQRPS
jgi:hypothetical protein